MRNNRIKELVVSKQKKGLTPVMSDPAVINLYFVLPHVTLSEMGKDFQNIVPVFFRLHRSETGYLLQLLL